MIKEYKLAKGWAIFIYLTTPLLLLAFVYLLTLPLWPGMADKKTLQLYWLLAPVSVGMITICILGFLDALKGRFIITGERVCRKAVFTSRELLLHQIAGFRADEKYIYIEPTDKSLKRIKLSRYFDGIPEILQWLDERFPDLDEQEVLRGAQAALEDDSLGLTFEERQATIAQASRRAKLINWSGGLIAAWTIFFTQPYELSILASALVPVVAILASRYSNGFIRVAENKKSIYPSVFTGLFFPSLVLCLRAMLDFNLLEYGNAWKLTLLVAAIFMTLLLVQSREFVFQSLKDYGLAAFFAVLAVAYGFGLVVTLNGAFDKSKPSLYPAQVISKRISSGKSTTYYLRLTPWGPQKESDDVTVSKQLYNRLRQGDAVNVGLWKGWLGIPWFAVSPVPAGEE